MKVQFFIQIPDCQVCGWKKWPVRTFIDHLNLIPRLLIANVNYCLSRKAFTLLCPTSTCAVPAPALQLASELSS